MDSVRVRAKARRVARKLDVVLVGCFGAGDEFAMLWDAFGGDRNREGAGAKAVSCDADELRRLAVVARGMGMRFRRMRVVADDVARVLDGWGV